MTAHAEKIFSKSDHTKLKKAQRKLHDLLPMIDDADACGTDCEAFRSVVNEIGKQLGEIEQRFMTPIPK